MRRSWSWRGEELTVKNLGNENVRNLEQIVIRRLASCGIHDGTLAWMLGEKTDASC